MGVALKAPAQGAVGRCPAYRPGGSSMIGPRGAIVTCLRKSLIFSGRASRPEFWWFAPIGLAIALIMCWLGASAVDDRKPITLAILAVTTFLGFVPFASAGSRRLQDCGCNGQDIFLPISPIIALMLIYSLSAHIGLGFVYSAIFFPGFGFLFLGLLYYIALICFMVIAPILGLMFLGPTIGQLLVPSEPGTNRFGPNPNEVPS